MYILITSLHHCHCTVKANRLLGAPLPSPDEIQKKDNGAIEVFSASNAFVIEWVDSKAMILALNYQTHELSNTCKRYNRTKKAQLDLNQPCLIRKYNAGVDHLDGFMNNL